MADERWKECKHHHDGCACREHAWAEQVARLKFELDVEKSNYECLKGEWNRAVALAQEHCPKPVLGQAWLTDGIPLLAERAKRAEAEVERLKGDTYCAYCGERFPLDAPDSCEQIGNHIQVCPKHPMREVEEKYEEVRATMRRMDVSAVESRTERNSLRVRVAELGAEVERIREEIKTAHADGASALVASFENTDPKARVCELEAEVDRLKQATARAYPDSVAQVVEGIKVYPQSTNGELEAEVGRIRKERGDG